MWNFAAVGLGFGRIIISPKLFFLVISNKGKADSKEPVPGPPENNVVEFLHSLRAAWPNVSLSQETGKDLL